MSRGASLRGRFSNLFRSPRGRSARQPACCSLPARSCMPAPWEQLALLPRGRAEASAAAPAPPPCRPALQHARSISLQPLQETSSRSQALHRPLTCSVLPCSCHSVLLPHLLSPAAAPQRARTPRFRSTACASARSTRSRAATRSPRSSATCIAWMRPMPRGPYTSTSREPPNSPLAAQLPHMHARAL